MRNRKREDADAIAKHLVPDGADKDFPLLGALARLVPGLDREVAELLVRAYRLGQGRTTWTPPSKRRRKGSSGKPPT